MSPAEWFVVGLACGYLLGFQNNCGIWRFSPRQRLGQAERRSAPREGLRVLLTDERSTVRR
jgi:hypothetical protein